MTIHLDTNILPLKGALKGGAVAALLRIALARGLTVALPEIVVHESVNLRYEKIREEVAKVRKVIAEASAYFPLEAVYLPQPLEVVQDWEDTLRATFSIVPTNDSDASEALRREARRVAPASKGRGGRDTLIWLTILRASQTISGPTYLVTNNAADFAGAKGSNNLRPELQKEAEQAGVEITLCTSIEDLLSHFSERIEFDVPLGDVTSSIDGYDVVSELLSGSWSETLEEESERPWEGGTRLVIKVAEVKTHRAYKVDTALFAWATSECTLHFDYADGTSSHEIRIHVDAWFIYENDIFSSIEVASSARLPTVKAGDK